MKSRQESKETQKWVLFYDLLAELHPSKSAKRARAIIFARVACQKPERAKKASSTDVVRQLRSAQRMVWLADFRGVHPGATAVSIYKHPLVRVSKGDWYRWTTGQMPDSSKMAKRIKAYMRTEQPKSVPEASRENLSKT